MAMASPIPSSSWGSSNAEYHANTEWWGSTMLKTFRDSPGLAWDRYIEKSNPPMPPTPQMEIGSAVHGLLLEPDAFDSEFVLTAAPTRSAKAYKEAKEQSGGKSVLTLKESESVLAMKNSVVSGETVASRSFGTLLDNAIATEYAYSWTDKLSQVPLKVKFDLISEVRGGLAMVSFKTTTAPSPEAYGRHAYNFDYHCQDALYEMGFLHLANAYGVDVAPSQGHLCKHAIIAGVHNKEPYEVFVRYAEDGYDEWDNPRYLELGRQQIRKDLERLGSLLGEKDRSMWAADWESEIGTVALPRYAKLR